MGAESRRGTRRSPWVVSFLGIALGLVSGLPAQETNVELTRRLLFGEGEVPSHANAESVQVVPNRASRRSPSSPARSRPRRDPDRPQVQTRSSTRAPTGRSRRRAYGVEPSPGLGDPRSLRFDHRKRRDARYRLSLTMASPNHDGLEGEISPGFMIQGPDWTRRVVEGPAPLWIWGWRFAYQDMSFTEPSGAKAEAGMMSLGVGGESFHSPDEPSSFVSAFLEYMDFENRSGTSAPFQKNGKGFFTERHLGLTLGVGYQWTRLRANLEHTFALKRLSGNGNSFGSTRFALGTSF